MRFLMKIGIPTSAENAVVSDFGFEETLKKLYVSVGAQKAYFDVQDGRRFDYVLVDVTEVAQITIIAKSIFEFLKVKPEFLPEIAPERFGF